MTLTYQASALTLPEVQALRGPTVLQFGTDWCGHCQAAAPLADAALAGLPPDARILVEDGPGRALGRAFRVKLWPTLVFLQDGQEVARVVRPTDQALIDQALAQLSL
jgi:thioredoxin 1